MSAQPTAWICTVCGYVHHGSQPPEVCPVCGAGSELFDPHVQAAAVRSDSGGPWRCLNCKYVDTGKTPPEKCPVCGAAAERFEPLAPVRVATGRLAGQKLRIVIAGAGIAGISAAEAARQAAPDAEIIVLSKEEELPYYRLNLTRYLAAEIGAAELPLHPQEWYRDNSLTLEYGAELCSIDRQKNEVQLRGGATLSYDRLILAIGSHPYIPAIPGTHRQNVTVLRTHADADFLLEQARGAERVAVIGGGLLGLEAAGALARRGIAVSLLEGHGWLLPRQLTAQGGALLEEFVEGQGISLIRNAETAELVGDERVRGVQLQDGRIINAQVVVIATGVRANSYIARLASLDVNNGIVVDNFLQTSAPGIYAAGDTAEHHGVLYGTWGPSQFMGSMAGTNAAGGSAPFAGIARSNMLKVLGYDLFSIGSFATPDASFRAVSMTEGRNYYHFVFRDTHLVGSILLGDTSLAAVVKGAIEKKSDCSVLTGRAFSARDVREHFLQG